MVCFEKYKKTPEPETVYKTLCLLIAQLLETWNKISALVTPHHKPSLKAPSGRAEKVWLYLCLFHGWGKKPRLTSQVLVPGSSFWGGRMGLGRVSLTACVAMPCFDLSRRCSASWLRSKQLSGKCTLIIPGSVERMGMLEN